MIIYWGQSIIIGFYNFIKILNLKNFTTENFKINGQTVEPNNATKYKTAIFFVFHYGLFHVAYLSFILNVFSFDMSNLIFPGIAVTIFFFDHAYSFKQNFKEVTKKKQNIGTVMFFPYARIIPMHAIIMLGAYTNESIIPFLLLKTIADLLMQAIEYKM